MPAAGAVLEVTRFTDSQRMSSRSQRWPRHGARVLHRAAPRPPRAPRATQTAPTILIHFEHSSNIRWASKFQGRMHEVSRFERNSMPGNWDWWLVLPCLANWGLVHATSQPTSGTISWSCNWMGTSGSKPWQWKRAHKHQQFIVAIMIAAPCLAKNQKIFSFRKLPKPTGWMALF